MELDSSEIQAVSSCSVKRTRPDTNPDVIGLKGDASALSVVERYMRHSNAGVGSAANLAVRRLRPPRTVVGGMDGPVERTCRSRSCKLQSTPAWRELTDPESKNASTPAAWKESSRGVEPFFRRHPRKPAMDRHSHPEGVGGTQNSL
jgi:hypothetical protein